MSSETRIAHARAFGRRHGRSRAWASNHAIAMDDMSGSMEDSLLVASPAVVRRRCMAPTRSSVIVATVRHLGHSVA